MSDPIEVLDFWLSEMGPEGWYAGTPEVDEQIRERFSDLWQAASEGGIEHWIAGPAATLAYLIVTDQFPRNLWRGQGKAFATDAMALAAAKVAIAEGWDMEAPEPERQFFYLPFMHSEDLAEQEYCIGLMAERMPETGASNHLHARAHTEVIRRYGRFPYRNEALGRETTAEEAAFLEAGGYMSVVNELKAAEA